MGQLGDMFGDVGAGFGVAAAVDAGCEVEQVGVAVFGLAAHEVRVAQDTRALGEGWGGVGEDLGEQEC